MADLNNNGDQDVRIRGASENEAEVDAISHLKVTSLWLINSIERIFQTNTTLAVDKSHFSLGEITIDSGVTVTVGSRAIWYIQEVR